MRITSTEILIFAAATAPFWLQHLKTVGTWILGFFKGLLFTTVEFDSDLGKMLSAYMAKEYKAVRWPSPLTYKEGRHYVRPLGQYMSVLFRSRTHNDALYIVNGWPVLVCGPGSVVDNTKSYSFPFKLRYIVGTVDHEALARAAQTAYDAVAFQGSSSRFQVTRIYGSYRKEDEPTTNDSSAKKARLRFHEMSDEIPVGFEPEELGLPHSKVALQKLFLRPEVLEMIDEIRFWYENKEWYEERGIPWGRGYTLHGQPGTGKTAVVRGTCEELDIPLYLPDLASMDNAELISQYEQFASNTPCAVFFEDFDAVFHGRKNVANPQQGVTFDCLLNCIAGAGTTSGILLFISTNRLDLIDEALSAPKKVDGQNEDDEAMPTRPGRIDREIEIIGLDDEGRYKLALRILKDEAKAREIADKGKNDTPAQLQERAFRRATRDLWAVRKKGEWKPAPATKKQATDGEDFAKLLNNAVKDGGYYVENTNIKVKLAEDDPFGCPGDGDEPDDD